MRELLGNLIKSSCLHMEIRGRDRKANLEFRSGHVAKPSIAASRDCGTGLQARRLGCETALTGLRDGRIMQISPDGHYFASSNVEDEIVYVVETDSWER